MTERGNIGGVIQEVRTEVDREFMFYDRLPAAIRRVAMFAPYEFSMEAIYNDYILWQRDNWYDDPSMYVPRMEATFIGTMRKNSPPECCGHYKLEKRNVTRKSVQAVHVEPERPGASLWSFRSVFGD